VDEGSRAKSEMNFELLCFHLVGPIYVLFQDPKFDIRDYGPAKQYLPTQSPEQQPKRTNLKSMSPPWCSCSSFLSYTNANADRTIDQLDFEYFVTRKFKLVMCRVNGIANNICLGCCVDHESFRCFFRIRTQRRNSFCRSSLPLVSLRPPVAWHIINTPV
jgi:hypothetical protein